MIETVRGPISKEAVHNTLAHEHLVYGYPDVSGSSKNPYDRDVAFCNCLERIDMVKPYDVNLIVDPTPIANGRDPQFIRKLSDATDVHIVCATGFYKDEEESLSLLKSISYISDLEDWMRDLFLKELKQGIGKTGIKAGIIKVASSLGEIKALEELIMKAASRAQILTGVPIYTHCDRGTMASSQAKLFRSEGVDPSKVLIGHQTSNRSLDEIRSLMDEGFMIGFDQFGIVSIPDIPNEEEKTENLISLLRNGYEDHIVLSHDCIFDRMSYVSRSKPRYPDHVYKDILPVLREKGFSEETIRKLIRNNLLRMFE